MENLREGLAQIPRDVSHVVGSPPSVEEIFTPTRHSLALDPDLPIIVGARGTGKSFWASVFSDNTTRLAVAPKYPRLHLANIVAIPGFVDQAIENAVTRESLNELAQTNPDTTARLWMLVVLRAAESAVGSPSFSNFMDGLSLYASSEHLELRLREINDRLDALGLKVVVIFDALDRLSSDWEAMRLRTSTLLETLIKIRAFHAIRLKLFMRPEQLNSVPTTFTDLSKLRAGAFDLRWTALDLYGLTYSTLLNNQTTQQSFNDLLEILRFPRPEIGLGGLQLPAVLLRYPDAQEALFVALAGRYMGLNARRGRTYTWLPKHLSDTKGRLTPRSFLLALGAAARHERMPPIEHALSIDGIKHGVSEASVLRVEQLKDEYGWIDQALRPLAGLEVPCAAQAIYDRWFQAETLASIRADAAKSGYLPPAIADYDDPNAVRDLMLAMMEIGIIELRPDARVNIPDLFRIAALMLRRGGPAPLPVA